MTDMCFKANFSCLYCRSHQWSFSINYCFLQAINTTVSQFWQPFCMSTIGAIFFNAFGMLHQSCACSTVYPDTVLKIIENNSAKTEL